MKTLNKKNVKSSNFRNVYASLNTFSIESLFCPVAELIMAWFHGLKTRHEKQKSSDYLKIKPFPKITNYFWNISRELLEKKLNIQSSLREVFLKNMS